MRDCQRTLCWVRIRVLNKTDPPIDLVPYGSTISMGQTMDHPGNKPSAYSDDIHAELETMKWYLVTAEPSQRKSRKISENHHWKIMYGHLTDMKVNWVEICHQTPREKLKQTIIRLNCPSGDKDRRLHKEVGTSMNHQNDPRSIWKMTSHLISAAGRGGAYLMREVRSFVGSTRHNLVVIVRITVADPVETDTESGWGQVE